MASSHTPSSILNILYTHLDPYDWEDGIDIYQSGKVKEFQNYTGLVSAKVENLGPRSHDTRIKFHPNGKVVQWFECSCLKNRKNGYFCEHLIALMVHIDREQPSLFENLDKKVPIKLPKVRKKKSNLSEEEVEAAKKKLEMRSGDAFMSFVERGNLISITQSKNPGRLQVKFEIKAGMTDSYELSLEDSSKLIADGNHTKHLKGNAKGFQYFPHIAFPSISIQTNKEGDLTLERVVAFTAHDSFMTESEGLSKISFNQYDLVEVGNSEASLKKYITIPFRKVEKYFSDSAMFIPGLGYFSVNTSKTSGIWYDLPYTKKLKDNDAGELLENNFSSYMEYSVILAEENLANFEVVTPELSSLEVKKNTGSWFYLDPQYKAGEHSISMMELIKHAREKKKKYIQSKGQWFKIPDAISSFEWGLDESDDLLKLDTIGLLRFRASVGEFDGLNGSKELIESLVNSIDFEKNDAPPQLSDTNLNLRSYQNDGYGWLWWLYSRNLHGLLADDMGLGKTHQSMALLSAAQQMVESSKDAPKFLVVCPTTVLEHWEDKIIEFSPRLRPIKYHGPKRRPAFNFIKKDDHTLITSYGVLLRDVKLLSSIDWDVLILDEAHIIKNNSTATYKAVCKINSKMRLCLTGTPIENELSELKTLYDFMIPGYLGSDKYFKKNYLKPLTGEGEEADEKRTRLRKLINPLKMRRTKSEVLDDLPEKVEDLRHCILSDEQVTLYKETVSLKAAPIINTLEDDAAPVPYMHVFATLQLLKQICNHPALVTGKNWKLYTSGKFELFKELLNEAFRSEHKVVVFTQYVGMIKIISEYLNSISVRHVTLTGATRNRGKVIEDFQTSKDCKVFVGSLLAGGVGIDLTAASVVIHYDRWWNASKENQATDRVHRIGQKNSVQVIKLVSKGTLEEKIDLMIEKKKKLFEQYMTKDEELFKKLTKEELIDLLSG